MYTVRELLESHEHIEAAIIGAGPVQDPERMNILLGIRASLEARIHYQLSRFKISQRSILDAVWQNELDGLVIGYGPLAWSGVNWHTAHGGDLEDY